ncbi:MAG: hypothetical protein ACE5Z5_01195 [Candidatus Bathyarchaeia archaeon]
MRVRSLLRIVSTLNYVGIDLRYYQIGMPRLLEYVEDSGLKVMWKKELKPYLLGVYSEEALKC